ncbi:MAG: hypothetical protein PHI41_09420 [Erysipelotrichaceae bacterium]|nr:hypothetical protein [Erysipelotrichaceae bacterium]
MNKQGFGLVTVLGIFLVASVLIVSVLTLSSYQSNQTVRVMVEDQLELTAQNSIDMVAAAIENKEAQGGDLSGMIPDLGQDSYTIDINLQDDSFGEVTSARIERTKVNVAIIYVTVAKGNVEYDLSGVMVVSGFKWGLQNYAK